METKPVGEKSLTTMSMTLHWMTGKMFQRADGFMECIIDWLDRSGEWM